MTPKQFKAARDHLCLTQAELAGIWGMGEHGRTTIGRWETGRRPINPIAAYCIRLMMEGMKE